MLIRVIVALLESIALTVGAFHSVWQLQTNGYTARKYYRQNWKYAALIVITGCGALCVWLIKAELTWLELAFALVFLALSVTITHTPPLRFTPRAKRLCLATAVLLFVVGLFLPLWVALFGVHIFVLLAFFALLPFEKANNRRYIKRSAETLSSTEAVKIAVVGSYAKTTVKTFLKTILSVRYAVTATPDSVNTPLGIAKFVNGGGLSRAEYCVFEFGARHKGDIAELCAQVKPDIGVLTGIAPQHLETFKTLENVIAAKSEILALPSEKICFVNACDENARTQIGMCQRVLVGAEYAIAENVKTTKDGSEFELLLGKERLKCKTKLLGKHNIENICLAAAVAKTAGLSAAEIITGISMLKAAPHRLQLIRGKVGTIIDDSYNANIRGIQAAADVLKLFVGKKYVITQGIVEGGKFQVELNERVGKILAEAVDKAVVLGKNADALARGLINGGVSKADILYAPTVSDGVTALREYLNRDSVLLFQNDIPN